MQLDCDPPSQNRALTCSCDGLHAWEDHFEHQTTAQTTQEVTATQTISLTTLLETSTTKNRNTTVQGTSTNAKRDTTIHETSTDVYRETTIQETSPDIQSTAVSIHQTSNSTHSRSTNIQEATLINSRAAVQESSITSGEHTVAMDTSTASPVTEADDITQSTPATLELSRSTDTVMTNSITPKPHIPHTVVSTRVPDVTSDVAVFPSAQMTTFSSTHKTMDTVMEHSTRPAHGGYMTTDTVTTVDTATTAMKQHNISGEFLL